MQAFAELFDSWQEYTDMTSRSINAGVSLFSVISGSFSYAHQEVKKHHVRDKSSTARVQIRRHLYTIKAQPDAELTQAFKNRLLEIGSHILTNNTRLASYTAQLLVRDFGTHYTTSVDVGAILAQEDSIKKTFLADNSFRKSEVKAAVSATFFERISVGFGFGTSTSHETKSGYMRNLASSSLKSVGGPGFKNKFTLDDWESGLENNLVSIDKSGDPIYYVITPATLPEVPDPIRKEIAQYVEKAVGQYYKFNTYRGCTKRDSPNFSFTANIDDGSCSHALSNYTFGGVYQTCSVVYGGDQTVCDKLSQKNPLTGDFTCPQEYTAVKVAEGVESFGGKDTYCEKTCKRCGFLWLRKCCNSKCEVVRTGTEASYTGFWCAATGSVQQGSGYMFGGVYTSTHSNLLTQSFSCPPHFHSLKVGSDMKVCVGDDIELGGVYQVPFAGFFSCKSGNPLALTMPHAKVHKRSLYSFFQQQPTSGLPHRCPSGYTQHLADLDNGCEINYCVKANSLSSLSLVKLIRPPFEKKPEKKGNSTNLLFMMGSAGEQWMKNDTTSEWKLIKSQPVKPSELQAEDILRRASHTRLESSESELQQAVNVISSSLTKQAVESDNTSNGIGVPSAVGITIGSIAFIALVIFVTYAVLWRRKKNSYREAMKNDCDSFYVDQQAHDNYGSVDGRQQEQRV